MKLSQYAKQQGISYRKAPRWFRTGTIKGYQVSQVVKEIESGVNYPEDAQECKRQMRVRHGEAQDATG